MTVTQYVPVAEVEAPTPMLRPFVPPTGTINAVPPDPRAA
jgi:hypothetical protein